MIDAFLVFFLVSLLPMAIPVGLAGSRTESLLFGSWRIVQVAVLVVAGAWVAYRVLLRGRWSDRVILLVLALVLTCVALSYSYIEWDAHIEYHRVILLAQRYHGLWSGYRHGVTGWILGYPPGTSLSALWHTTVRMRSPNVAQDILFLFWSGSLLARHLHKLDAMTNVLFFALLLGGAQFPWHLTYFYNNLFFALISAEFVFLPLLGLQLRPWERCCYALVLVWLRPQWQIAAVPICCGGLIEIFDGHWRDRRFITHTALLTIAAVAVAWLGSSYWYRIEVRLQEMMTQQISAIQEPIAARQDPHTLHIEVETVAVERQEHPPPKLLSKASVDAIDWAYRITRSGYAIGLWLLVGIAAVALLTLRRRGLLFLVPLLCPLSFIVGTAVFARVYPAYRDNGGALERMQLIIPVLVAGMAAALHARLRRETDDRAL